MAAPVSTPTGFPYASTVLIFAARNQVDSYLDPLREVLQRLFPTATSLRVYLEEDPEIQDDWHIVFDIQVPAADVPDFVKAKGQWQREAFRICPAPLICLFRLCLDLVA